MGGEERVARHVAAGRLPVRERIDRLLDADSFREVGTLAAKVEYDEDGNVQRYTPSNFVTGRGTIDGRPVVIGCDDFSVRGGAQDGAVGNKMGWSEKQAREWRVPVVRLVDGTGGGGSVKTNTEIKRSYVPALPDWEVSVALLSEVPVVAAALGPVAGMGAARVAGPSRCGAGLREGGGQGGARRLGDPRARQRRRRQRGGERGRGLRAHPPLSLLPAGVGVGGVAAHRVRGRSGPAGRGAAVDRSA
jgi:hypothetical protein